MPILTPSQRSQVYNELAEATSPMTAEVIVQSVVDVPWDSLVTTDHLDARIGQIDARFAQLEARMDTGFAQAHAKLERALRRQTVWFTSVVFGFGGLLAALLSVIH